MKPIDVFVRDQASPILKSLQFKRRGKSFTRDTGDGITAFVNFREHRRGKAEVEFHCNLALVVDTYADFVWRYDQRPQPVDESLSMWRFRLLTPFMPKESDVTWWSLNPEESEKVAVFQSALATEVENLLALANVEALLTIARSSRRHVPNLYPNPVAAEALLLLKTGEFDRIRELLPLVAENSPSGEMAEWIAERMQASRNVG